MTSGPIIATVLCYAVLAILLLSLNFTSLWRWWVKAAAILLTAMACVGSYFSIVELLGWPSAGAMPERFSLISTRVIEPNAALGQAGDIYLWIEEIDENQIVISPPRAFRIPFEAQLFFEVEAAQEVLDEGGSILGELDKSEVEVATDQAEPRETAHIGKLSSDNAAGGASSGDARFRSDSAPSLVFSNMPPVGLPAKE